MYSSKNRLAAILICLAAYSPVHGAVHHALNITLDPAGHYLEAEDRISLDKPATEPLPALEFTLHADLDVVSPNARLETLDSKPSRTGAVPLRHYRIVPDGDLRNFTLRYSGRIHHPVSQSGGEFAGGVGETPGAIGEDGIFLAHVAHWYPQFEGQFITFDLITHLPPGWESVSQGKRIRHEASAAGNIIGWAESAPQKEIYLIAAPFHVYEQSTDTVRAMAYLREADAPLAQKYLDATGRYIEMYRQLIGPYPYAKFALVENLRETGYGMPSFTLLGRKVIRLPFIVHTSYPHEILHNWWGNGVFVDYGAGNWAEGLTAYLSDHLMKEHRGQGAGHRRQILQHYTDFVDAGKDFPLTEFRARHGSVTEAVGYGKAQMMFHMLRRKIGDDAFKKALRRFFMEFRFKTAGYGALEQVFSEVSGSDLSGFFAQWVERTGAPRLAITFAGTEPSGSGFRLTAQIEQRQSGDAYTMDVPLAISLAGDDKAFEIAPTMTGKRLAVRLDLPKRPVHLAVDPRFDLFRRLHRDEIPPALSQAFGADKALLILPAGADNAEREAYRDLAKAWRGSKTNGVGIALDSEVDALPADRAIWLFGQQNRFLPVMTGAMERYDAMLDANQATLNGKTFT
ncbi:MAG: peptidase M28, partial [Gammaproteobacteria bacterium]|nr:peptidase M28 [Gammaproteobacteria bacterium]NNJ84090.1 peptidase M28 [Gammaproteobacteria bacterium]